MDNKKDYLVKVDDMLLYLLKEYHDVDASEALAFFSERVNEMKTCEPNITNKSRPAKIDYYPLDKRTIQSKRYRSPYKDSNKDARFYVLRGFYPESNIPFKVIAVFNSKPKYLQDPVHVKVVIGMKPHWTSFSNEQIDKYKEHAADCALLDMETREEFKIPYKYRKFKCMRPKGMELYRERNYVEKKKKANRVAAKKRRERKALLQANKLSICNDAEHNDANNTFLSIPDY